jgi:hypothetical protein
MNCRSNRRFVQPLIEQFTKNLCCSQFAAAKQRLDE